MRVATSTKQRLATFAAGSILLFVLWTQVDLDGDGLTTQREWDIHTDSLRADTDGDTIDDGWEVAHGLMPLATDSDADSLDDRAELANRTNPLHEDSDGDDVSDPREFAVLTDPRDSDSDDDTLDDALELELLTDPLRDDTEGDGVPDAREVLDGANPHAGDTDQDGIPDAQEPRTDCNGNRKLAIADADDDEDQRVDGKEVGDERCRPDFDADGVLDGLEGNLLCIRTMDCDGDGVVDGAERANRFDPLNSDTFGTGLNDAIALAFQQRNQPPSGDGDDDGIPDAWEAASGLIAWGAFAPRAGQRDLLVEFVRVSGPDSGRYAYLDFKPAYDATKAVFDAAGLRMQWVETVVTLSSEDRPSLIPSSYARYYEDVLLRARHSTNPYVTTVVMNPQHDQSQVLHLGVAPIRGTLAAVDYGHHTNIHFVYTYYDHVFDWSTLEYVQVPRTGNVVLTPLLESYIAGNRQDLVRGLGFSSGGLTSGGEYVLRSTGLDLRWRPFWFASNPYVISTDGEYLALRQIGATVDTGALAHTILHELGHTLGLCHAHEPDCYVKFSPRDQFRTRESTMSYESTSLGFLSSEWQTIGTYLTCPPQDALASVARGAPASQVIDEKYGYALSEVLNADQRRCGVPVVLTSDLSPDGSPMRFQPAYRRVAASEITPSSNVYVLPWTPPFEAQNSVWGTVGFFGVGLALAGVSAVAAPWGVSRGLRFLRRQDGVVVAAAEAPVFAPAASNEVDAADAFHLLDLAGGPESQSRHNRG